MQITFNNIPTYKLQIAFRQKRAFFAPSYQKIDKHNSVMSANRFHFKSINWLLRLSWIWRTIETSYRAIILLQYERTICCCLLSFNIYIFWFSTSIGFLFIFQAFELSHIDPKYISIRPHRCDAFDKAPHDTARLKSSEIIQRVTVSQASNNLLCIPDTFGNELSFAPLIIGSASSSNAYLCFIS